MQHWQGPLCRQRGRHDRGLHVRSGAGYSPDQAGLLAIRHAISNFDIYKRRAQCEGWSEKPGAKVCNWAGVTCANGQVTGLHFLNNGSVLVGARTGPCQVTRPPAAAAAAAFCRLNSIGCRQVACIPAALAAAWGCAPAAYLPVSRESGA
jgi:hypothetical protein